MGFFLDLFAFRLRSRPIEDLRPANDSARHAGHDDSISFLKRALLSRFAFSATDLTFWIVVLIIVLTIVLTIVLIVF